MAVLPSQGICQSVDLMEAGEDDTTAVQPTLILCLTSISSSSMNLSFSTALPFITLEFLPVPPLGPSALQSSIHPTAHQTLLTTPCGTIFQMSSLDEPSNGASTYLLVAGASVPLSPLTLMAAQLPATGRPLTHT